MKDRPVWLVKRVWFWPTLLTGALGAARIGTPELWRDELRSWSAASRPVGELFHLLGTTDAAVALYYLLLHFWMLLFGDSAVAMRALSAVAMAGAAACVALIGQRLVDRRVAIIGGLLFAIIPATSRFAQEARPYALTILAAGLSTLLLLRAFEKPSRGRSIAYAASIAILALTQVVALPLLLVHAVGVLLFKRDRSTIIRWSIAVVVGLAVAAPVILLSSAQYDHQVGSLPTATVGELGKLPARLFMSSLLAGAIAMLGVLAVLTTTAQRKAMWFLAAWAVLPIMAIWVVSNLGQSFWMTRYMLFTLPAFALLAALILARLNTRMAVVAMLVVAALGAQDQRELRWLGSHDQWTYPDEASTPVLYSDAAQTIEENMRPGDAIAYGVRQDYWLLDIGMAYHLRHSTMPRDVFVTETALQRGDFWPVECQLAADCLANDPPERIWVVTSDAVTEDIFHEMESSKAAVLMYRYYILETWHPSGLNVALLERMSPTSR